MSKLLIEACACIDIPSNELDGFGTKTCAETDSKPHCVVQKGSMLGPPKPSAAFAVPTRPALGSMCQLHVGVPTSPHPMWVVRVASPAAGVVVGGDPAARTRRIQLTPYHVVNKDGAKNSSLQ